MPDYLSHDCRIINRSLDAIDFFCPVLRVYFLPKCRRVTVSQKLNVMLNLIASLLENVLVIMIVITNLIFVLTAMVVKTVAALC